MHGVYCVPAGEYDPAEWSDDAQVIDGFDIFWVVDDFDHNDFLLLNDGDEPPGSCSHALAAFRERSDAVDWMESQR